MASTSSNKQPLLIDHVLHEVINLDNRIIGQPDVVGTNDAIQILNAISSDGVILESIYTISRSTTAYKVNLYFSSSSDYLRPIEGVYIGTVTAATTKGTVVEWEDAPKILAPFPQTGTEAQFRALYVPKGVCLWAAVESESNVTEAPLLGVQGGWY